MVLVSRLSYTDKILLNGKKVDTVPSLKIAGSAIYKRRQMEALNYSQTYGHTSISMLTA